MDYAIILAGGIGSRLWPMSRRSRPKQLLPLVQGESLLSLAVKRVRAIFPRERTFIVTNDELVAPIRAAGLDLPDENVIGEPAVRDTSNAIGLACMILAARDADARVGIFTADHVIQPIDRFASAVRDGLAALDDQPGALVTLGVLPTWPHSGLGYIRRGQALRDKMHRVERFVEKPDRATAQGYVASGDYYWNSGMFIWRTATLIEQLGRFAPEQTAQLREAAAAWADKRRDATADIYRSLPKISIDYALMEPATRQDAGPPVLVRELDCQWLDLGAWTVLPEVNAVDEGGNLRLGQVAAMESAGNILISENPGHLLAVIGLEDLVVVHSGNATLVAPKSRTQEVKKLLDQVREQFGPDYE